MAEASSAGFSALTAEEKEAVRAAQAARKEARLKNKREKKVAAAAASDAADGSTSARDELLLVTRCEVTQAEYFDAVPGGRFKDPNLPATAESLDLLLHVLERGDEQAKALNQCSYFQFAGPAKQIWDPSFNARLAWEGFFTITADTGPGRRNEPLPELQPYYVVLLWPNF